MENFPVLGVCGPAKSGKDMVGDWICENKRFQKVAFADPMKRFVRAVFQVDYETLWGPSSLREKPISYSDKEWFDAAARFSPAGNELINEVVTENKIPAYLTLTEWFSSMRASHQKQGHITMREVLQTLGTEWGRRKVHDLIWVTYLYEKVVPALLEGIEYRQEKGLLRSEQIIVRDETPEEFAKRIPAGVVIPDTRFLNEVLGNRRYGGFTMRIRRLALEKEGAKGNVGIENHQSEMEMRDIPDSKFDKVLELGEGPSNVYPALEKLFEEKPWVKAVLPTDTKIMESSSAGA